MKWFVSTITVSVSGFTYFFFISTILLIGIYYSWFKFPSSPSLYQSISLRKGIQKFGQRNHAVFHARVCEEYLERNYTSSACVCVCVCVSKIFELTKYKRLKSARKHIFSCPSITFFLLSLLLHITINANGTKLELLFYNCNYFTCFFIFFYEKTLQVAGTKREKSTPSKKQYLYQDSSRHIYFYTSIH